MGSVPKSYPLDPEVRATCAWCLKPATHYIVKVAMTGELLAVCDDHEREG